MLCRHQKVMNQKLQSNLIKHSSKPPSNKDSASASLYHNRPQTAKNNFYVINAKNNVSSVNVQCSFCRCFFWMPLLCRLPWAPRNGTVVTPAPNYNGALQWHHVHSQSWSTPFPLHTIAHYNGTLQSHHAPKVGHPPPPPTAHYNGTLQWHHAHSPKVGGHPPFQWHPAMAPRPLPRSGSSPFRNHSKRPTLEPSNGTTSTAPCHSRCHVQSAPPYWK